MLPLLVIALLQAAPTPPLPDWSAAPPLVYREPPEITAMMNQFVANEVLRGRCIVARPADGHYRLRIDVAVLVTGNGEVRATVPRAIDCPTIEQYGAGLVQSFARNNVIAPGSGDKWHRASLTFDWTE